MKDGEILAYLQDVQKDVRELRKDILQTLEEAKKSKLGEI